MIDPSYTIEMGVCIHCKHFLFYHQAYLSSYFCGQDGTRHPAAVGDNSISYPEPVTDDFLDKSDGWERKHKVETHGHCKLWEKHENG